MEHRISTVEPLLSLSAYRLAEAKDHYQIIGCSRCPRGTVGTTVLGTPPMVARCNEQVEALYEDRVKTRLDELI